MNNNHYVYEMICFHKMILIMLLINLTLGLWKVVYCLCGTSLTRVQTLSTNRSLLENRETYWFLLEYQANCDVH